MQLILTTAITVQKVLAQLSTVLKNVAQKFTNKQTYTKRNQVGHVIYMLWVFSVGTTWYFLSSGLW